MKTRLILIYILLFCFVKNDAQILIGAGYNRGYKSIYHEEGFFIETFIKNALNVNFGYSNGKYNGVGMSSEINYLLLKKNLRPFLGISYSNNNGREGNFKSDNLTGKYKISTNSFLHGKLGCSYLYFVKEPVNDLVIIVKLSTGISYRSSLSNINITYIEGDRLPNAESVIRKRVENGFGFYVSISILFGKNKK